MMDAKLAVREVMKMKGVGTCALADRLGKVPSFVCDRLSEHNGKSIAVSRINEMLRAMDYKIVIVPRERRLGDGEIEIE